MATTEPERGSSQLLPGAGSLGDLRGLEECRSRVVDLARSSLGVAQREKNLGPGVVIRDLTEVEHGQRHRVQPRRLLVRQRPRRIIPGPPRIFDGLGPDALDIAQRQGLVASLCGFDVVEGELGQMRIDRRCVKLLEDMSDPAVETHAPTRRQLGVQGLAHEVVREAVPTEHTGNWLQQSGLHRLVDEIERLVRSVVADPTQDLEAEFGAQHGAESESLSRCFAEVPDPSGDHRPDARGNGDSQ